MNGTENFDLEKTAYAAAGPEVTQVAPATQVEPTTMTANVECPICHVLNPPSEVYCTDCGFLLSEQPGQIEAIEEQPFFGVLVTPDGNREFALRLGENTVGRQDADILLTHNSVSRQHARIIVEQGRTLVQDVGSTNGTYVDGSKIEPGKQVELKDGAELLFGSSTLIYRAAAKEGNAAVRMDTGASGEPSLEVEEAETAVPHPSHQEETKEVAVSPGPPPGKGEPLVEPVAKLVDKSGTVVFDLTEGIYKIGRRQSENDLVLPDPYVSGRHAVLQIDAGRVCITDVGSSNGTSINGVKIQPNVACELHPGDEVTIGQTVLVLEAV